MVAATLALLSIAAPRPQRSSPAEALLDSAILAHRNLSACSAILKSESRLDTPTRYECVVSVVRPGQAMIRLKTPQMVGQAPTDRSYFVSGQSLTAYDHLADETISRRAAQNATLLNKIEAATGPLDEPIRALLDPAMMEVLLLRFRLMHGWQVSRKGDSIQMSRVGKEKGTSSFQAWTFDADSRLATGAKLVRGKQSVSWTIAYGRPPSKLSLVPLQTALPVDAFLQKPVIPRSMDPKTSGVLIRATLAFSKLRHASWTSREAGASAKVWVSGPLMRESSAEQDWAYDGQTLTVHLSRARLAYRGPCRFGAIPTALDRCGAKMDPTAWQYLSRKSPVLTLLGQRSAARIVGELELDGVPCDIVEFKDSTSIASVTVRRTDSLVAGTGFTRMDARGRIVSSTTRTVQFHALGKAPGRGMFQLSLPEGVKLQPIPKAKRG